MEKQVGHYSFMIGVILAVILGLAAGADVSGNWTPWLASLLIILGLIVGFLNVTGKETREFLLVATALVIVIGIAGGTAALNIEMIGKYVVGIVTQLMAFIVPAVIVVGLKDILALAKAS